MASHKTAIYSALIANLLIAITKFIAAGFTGSSAMVSEGVHSVVDTTNEILLLVGIRQSGKKPDRERPFGYGKELYFWSFIVSILIFGVGGGISFYEGITHILHPELIKDPHWNYIVLGIAFLFDGISFIIALKNFNKNRGNRTFWAAVKKTRDPASFAVLFEDAADVLGLMVAFGGVYLGHKFNNPYFDGIASVIIGCILAGISIVLAKESRSLLMGETASPQALADVIAMAESNPAIEKIIRHSSMVLSPDEILLILFAHCRQDLDVKELTGQLNEVKSSIQQKYPLFRQIIIEPG